MQEQNTQPTSPTHCTATGTDGNQCTAWATSTGLCPHHAHATGERVIAPTPVAISPHTSLDGPALDEQKQPRCHGTKKDGSPCTVERGLKHGLCPTHSGAVDHAAAARARGQAVAARRDDARATVQVEAERSKQGVRAAIRVRVAARADDIARVLVDEALDRTDGEGHARPDVSTLLRAIEQAHGRPGEAVEQPPVEVLTWEEEVALLVAQVEAQQGVPPTGEAPPTDTGSSDAL